MFKVIWFKKKKWKVRYLWVKVDYVYFLEIIEMKIREGFVNMVWEILNM